MKLILSSCDFRNEHSKKYILDNLGLAIKKCRILYFPNEKATKEAIKSDLYYNRLAEFGFVRENIYVFNYYGPAMFTNLNIDAVYISGGNTFATFDRIRKAGFCEKIVRYVKDGAVYIGGSAGAHIASANIEHVMQYDSNTPGTTDFRGLALFDGILICHYTDERKDDFTTLQRNKKYNVYALTNDESLIIDDGVKKI